MRRVGWTPWSKTTSASPHACGNRRAPRCSSRRGEKTSYATQKLSLTVVLTKTGPRPSRVRTGVRKKFIGLAAESQTGEGSCRAAAFLPHTVRGRKAQGTKICSRKVGTAHGFVTSDGWLRNTTTKRICTQVVELFEEGSEPFWDLPLVHTTLEK